MAGRKAVALGKWPLQPGRALLANLRFVRFRIVPEGLVVILVLLLASSFVAESISPFDPLSGAMRDRLQEPVLKPVFWQGHIMGTDQQGRDIFVRLLVGARYSFTVAAVALSLGGVIGLVLGMMAGYLGGAFDTVLMRIVDIMLAIPVVFLAMLLAAMFQPSLLLVSLALAFTYWAFYARMIRGEALSLAKRDYIKLAQVAGASRTRIILKHIFPHVTNTWIVLLSLQVGAAILAESSLSFLGAGVPPPSPAWGSMAAQGRTYLETAWWVSLFPGLAIILVVLCFNLLGDWLRDRLDPKYQ